MDVQDITFWSILFAGIELLGLLTAVHAIMNTRTAQGAIAWFFPLVLFPYAAIPLYWIFGRSRFQGYLVARRKGDTKVQQVVADAVVEFRQRFGKELEGPAQRFDACETLAGMPFTSGNQVKLLVDGQQTFDAIFEGIASAESYIFAEFFIIHDDQLGREFQRRLMEKAQDGVRVWLLYDEIGSHHLSKAFKQELVDAGVEIRPFSSTRGWNNRFQLNFRNHRKIVVVDGKKAYVGGLNVGDEYMGRGKKFGPWRDTHLAITGPAVACVQLAFGEDWYWSTGGQHLQGNWEVEQSGDLGQDVLVLPSGPADELESCGLFFTHLINSAKHRLWIASPYFVPDEGIVAALNLAALRGVDVRILLPNKADHLLVYLSSFSYIAETEPAGVKFYRYEPGFLHQKVVLVDDELAAVGTANFDVRSFRLNFEITIAAADQQFAADVEQMLQSDFENSRQVKGGDLHSRPFWFRLAVRCARLMAPVQ